MIWPSAAPNRIVVIFFLACDSQRRERGKIGIVIATEHSNQCVLLGGVFGYEARKWWLKWLSWVHICC